MADKPGKEENRKDGDDKADEEKTSDMEYSEDSEHLLEAERKRSKEEPSAGTSKPSTSKKGKKSGAIGSLLSLFKRSEKTSKPGEAEFKLSPPKQTTSETAIVGSEIRTTFGTFCEYSEEKVDFTFENLPEKYRELRRVESGGTIQSLLPEDDPSVTSEPYVSTRHTTGVVYQTVLSEEGGERKIEQKVVPLVELPQYPVTAVGTGLLAAASGLLAASVSTPALAADERSGAMLPATGGAIPEEIEASGEKSKLGDGVSPAKRSRKAILSPEIIDEKGPGTSGFQRLESTESNSPIPIIPKIQGLESGGSESAVHSPQVALEGIRIEPDSPFEMTDPTSSKDEEEESTQADPKDEKESEQTDPKVRKKSKE